MNHTGRHTHAHDPHRPRYHFLPPANWINDPNGLIQWHGRYHLFYQTNPLGAYHHRIHWGHAVSDDLAHWQDLPIALAPTPGGPDKDGCWSGCAVDDSGVPTLFYSGVHPQVVCRATSHDGLLTWQKDPHNPTLTAPSADIDSGSPPDFRDPFVWRENGAWYMLMGTRIVGQGGAVLLYRSHDLRRWAYLHPLIVGDRNRRDPFWTGTVWECPNIFTLGDRHVLIVSFQHHETGTLLYTGAFIGRFHSERFVPESLHLLDYGGHFYAPQILRDDHGRVLLWGWLTEGRPPADQKQSGWSGALSVPRVLGLDAGGRLTQTAVPELHTLRQDHHHVGALIFEPDAPNPLAHIRGDSLEISAEFDPLSATAFGLKLRCAPDGSEETRIMVDLQQSCVTIERERASLNPAVQHDVLPHQQAARSAPFALAPGEHVHLHIFLDRSVIEVFVNGRVALTSRIYPTRPDSMGVAVFARDGRVRLNSLDAWQMGASRE